MEMKLITDAIYEAREFANIFLAKWYHYTLIADTTRAYLAN